MVCYGIFCSRPLTEHKKPELQTPIKGNYCSFFCFLLTIDECIINVWGYTEILPRFHLLPSSFPSIYSRLHNHEYLGQKSSCP